MKRLLILLVVLGLSGCVKLLFYPEKPHVFTPEEIKLKFEDVYLESNDNTKLHAWFLPAKGKALGTVLHLHGNAENISTHIGSVYWLPERNFNVLLLDYRGYGKSNGKPSLEGVHADAEAALAYLVARKDIPRDKIIVFGQSLGGAIAIYTVANSRYRNHIKALIVESALSSYRKITQEKLASFWLTWPFQWPFSFTMPDAYSPLPIVHEISPLPFLVIHGDSDAIVPLVHGQRLFDAAKQPKQMWVVAGAGHTQAMRVSVYRQRLLEFMNTVLKD